MTEGNHIHGDSGREQDRLNLPSSTMNASFVEFLEIPDHSRAEICDLGWGTGNLMADIACSFPAARLTGVELSGRQCSSARENTKVCAVVTPIRGNPFASGLPEGPFDITYCRYVLEHVSDAVGAVREMARVTKAGGIVTSRENDLQMFCITRK